MSEWFSCKPEALKTTDDIFRLVENNRRHPISADPVERVLFEDLYSTLLTPNSPASSHLNYPGSLVYALASAIELRIQRGLYTPPSYGLRLLESCIDKQARQMVGFDEEIYPKRVHRGFFRSEVFPKLNHDMLYIDMQANLQSNPQEAGAIHQAAAKSIQATLGREPVFLDNGISLAMPWRKVFSGNPQRMTVIKQPARGEVIVPGEMPIDEEMQEFFDFANDEDSGIDRVIGYDIVPINTEEPDAMARLFSQTFLMSQSVRRAEAAEEFRKLQNMSSDRIVIPKAIVDAKDPESLGQLESVLRELPGGKADAATLNFMLYEHPKDVRQQIIENIKQYVGRYIFSTDFFRKTGDLWWLYSGTIATSLIDLDSNNPHPVVIAGHTTRLCNESWITPAGHKFLLEGSLD